MKENLQLAQRLRSLMGEMSANQLAKEVGVTHPVAGGWLEGQMPKKVKDLVALADRFGVKIDYLLGREGEELMMRETAPESDLHVWRRRAKEAEERLEEVRRGLRLLLEVSSAGASKGESAANLLVQRLAQKPQKGTG